MFAVDIGDSAPHALSSTARVWISELTAHAVLRCFVIEVSAKYGMYLLRQNQVNRETVKLRQSQSRRRAHNDNLSWRCAVRAGCSSPSLTDQIFWSPLIGDAWQLELSPYAPSRITFCIFRLTCIGGVHLHPVITGTTMAEPAYILPQMLQLRVANYTISWLGPHR